MTLQITKPNEQSLDEVVKESGLQIADGSEIKGAYLPYLEQFAEVVSEASKINPENPTKLDEEIASTLRKKIVKIRTGAEKLKEDRKKIHLIKGNLEQASFNVIKNSCLLAEEYFREVEEYSERQEALRIAALKNERIELLKPWCESPEMYPLGEMSEGAFADLLNGFKLAAEQKAKAEADRLEALRLEEERKERQMQIDKMTSVRTIKLLSEYQYTFTGETPLGELNDNDWELVLFQAKNEFEAKQKAEQRIIEENERLQKEKEAAEKKAAKERADQEARLKEERDAREKAEAELKAKAAAEEKARLEAQEAEKKRIAEEKKLAKAGDKKQLKVWLESFVFEDDKITDVPSSVSDEGATVAGDIILKYNGFKKWALAEIEKL